MRTRASLRVVLGFSLVTGGLLPSCASETPGQAVASCDDGSGERLFVVASDGSSSAVGVVSESKSALASGADLGGDPRLASSGGRLFVLARDFDVLFEFDSACGKAVQKRSTGGVAGQGSSNPQDVAVARDGTLWVPKYNVPTIALFSKTGASVGSIDLASFDEDGNPQAGAIAIGDFGGGEKAYVTVQRLDDDKGLRSTRPSYILRFDVATRAFEAKLELKARNPFSRFERDGDLLYLASAGDFHATNEPAAGIEVFDPKSFTSRLLVPETVLGGSVSQVAVRDGCGAAIVADATSKNRTALVTFDATTGAATTTYAAPQFGPTEGFELWALTWSGSELYLGDRRRGASGFPIHRYERKGSAGCAIASKGVPLVVPQKPVALVPMVAPSGLRAQ